MLIWKFQNARLIRCCVAFLHFLTKTQKNMVNRIREAYSLRSVGIADGLSVPAGHLTHSAILAPGPLLRISTPFRFLPAPHSVLRGPVFLCRCSFPASAGAWHSVRYTANCEHRREFRPVSLFFSETFFIKNIFPLIFFSFCILSQAVCTCLLYMFFSTVYITLSLIHI